MNRQNNTILIACGLATGIFAAPSMAQVAPPPTKPVKEQPTYTPAPKPTPVAKPEAKPADPQPKESFNARKRDPNNSGDLPTNVPYPKLAQPGPDGRILRLRQLPDILALRSNPNVGPASVEKIMPVVYSRRFHMETSVIDNLDLFWELTGGMIENMDMSNINEMGRAADMIKPLVPQTTLSQDLLNRQILSRVQGGMNQYIVREYKKAITDEIQVLDGENGLAEVMRFVLDDSLHEARLAYDGMLIEAMGQIDELIEKSGVDTSEAKSLIELKKQPALDPEQQFEDLREFDAAFRKLSYDDAMKILNTMRDSRKFKNIAPTIKTINVLHDRKKIMKSGFDAKVIDERTGETKLDTKNREDEQPEQEDGGED